MVSAISERKSGTCLKSKLQLWSPNFRFRFKVLRKSPKSLFIQFFQFKANQMKKNLLLK